MLTSLLTRVWGLHFSIALGGGGVGKRSEDSLCLPQQLNEVTPPPAPQLPILTPPRNPGGGRKETWLERSRLTPPQETYATVPQLHAVRCAAFVRRQDPELLMRANSEGPRRSVCACARAPCWLSINQPSQYPPMSFRCCPKAHPKARGKGGTALHNVRLGF